MATDILQVHKPILVEPVKHLLEDIVRAFFYEPGGIGTFVDESCLASAAFEDDGCGGFGEGLDAVFERVVEVAELKVQPAAPEGDVDVVQAKDLSKVVH